MQACIHVTVQRVAVIGFLGVESDSVTLFQDLFATSDSGVPLCNIIVQQELIEPPLWGFSSVVERWRDYRPLEPTQPEIGNTITLSVHWLRQLQYCGARVYL